jgi:hypothetical protein
MENNDTKPKAKLIGQDSNVFNLVGIASQALRRAGKRDEAKAMTERVFASGSYDEALSIIMEYCEVE